MWTKEQLHDLVKGKLSDYLFVVVSNREPYIHTYSGKEIITIVPASGLTTALDPVMRACGGTWIAFGGGNADKKVVDKDNKVGVPPGNPSYSLKRVWLTKQEEDGYYYGFSNEALWPLCHIAYTRPVFNESDWEMYKKVNEKFAKAVLDEVGDRKAFVFIQDYQLTLLSRLVKEKNPSIITAQFWHIPWPNPEAFRICPWQEEILKGLLGNDLLGFHIRYHCNNFMDTIDRMLEARVDRERNEITYQGSKTAIRPYPISVDFEDISRISKNKEVTTEIKRLKRKYGLEDEKIGVGFDRMDYTKGIPERFRAVARFFERYPEYSGKVIFIQGGVQSRNELESYQKLNTEINNLEEKINWQYDLGRWKAIIYIREHLSQLSLMALRRMADFFVVSSLHDGMNLVAKEFIASRNDEDGVLILSPFTGAARELPDALQVNPYATDYFADTIKRAIEMPREERQKRMRKMRETVKENNIYKWAADIITDLVKFEFGE
jgi:alpha,alpha-trehalose-phosphate synthase [UDP-forming]